MSTIDREKFVGGSQDKGISNFESEIGSEIGWTDDIYNISGGIRRGVAPRYGIAPLAGHSNTETPAANQNNGIQRSEITSGALGLTHRERIFGIVPITMAPYDGNYPKTSKQYYAYIVGLDYSTDVSLDVCLGSTLESSVYKQSSTFVAGLQASSYRQESPLIRLHKTELLNLPLTATPVAADMQAILKGCVDRYYIPYAHISISGKRIPYQWMFGAASSSTGSATQAPDIQLWNKTASVGTNPIILGGTPSEIQTREFTDNNQRILAVYCLDDDCYPMDLGYTKQITQANTQANPAYATGTNNYISLTGATKTGASVAYTDINSALINDPGSYTNSRHDAILVAGESPTAIVYQDWLKATTGMLPRFIDLTNPGCTPRSGLGFSSISGTNKYPTAFVYLGDVSIRVGDAETGFLENNKTYDVGFSYYNKLLDYETNVAFVASVAVISGVPTETNFSLFLEDINAPSAYGNVWQKLQADSVAPPWEFSNTEPKTSTPTGRGMHINDYEIRYYYRDSGIGEWLPAGSFDAAKFWFYKEWAVSGALKGPQICAGPSGSIPGGQPNGFNDYSPLPKQRYICSLIFQQRAFWFSEKSIHFSYANNIYAYPLRNTLTIETGKVRGGIVHMRINENIQQSRVVVFADATYAGRFTGERYVQTIQVSVNADGPVVGQFPIDGSDFVMEYLCDSTAFSYRSAVVAEGILYWWGPQGVYRDDGVTEPKKISLILEPNIFDYVDMGRDQEVHCVYNKRSHEIVWFYPPKVTDATYPTYALVLNVENGKFYKYKVKCQVDSSQNIKLENDTTPDGVDGERVLLHCRETSSSTVQRTYYFDELAMAGDQGPAQQLTVISFSTPATGQRRLTLATGSAGITASGIAADGYISLQNVKGYAPSLTLAPDMIAKIVAVNNGSNYIDIELPPDGTFDASGTLTGQTAFPIYHRGFDTVGLNGITYLLDTEYWLPNGLSESYVWQYIMFLFRYRGIPTPLDPFTLQDRHPQSLVSRINWTNETLVCEGPSSSVLNLINNSSGHCQLLHALKNENRSANGQALKFTLSGLHIGDPWTLEYLEAHCIKEQGYILKEFGD